MAENLLQTLKQLSLNKQYVLNSYASNLRDIADKDYICARRVYFMGLAEQFLWMGSQAIEKYLKAMALYHQVSVKKISHDLKSLFETVEDSTDIELIVDKQEKILVDKLNRGVDRYFCKEKRVDFNDLLLLDSLIFKIRWYCQNPALILNKQSDKYISAYNAKGKPLRVHGGYLEKIMYNAKSGLQREQAKALKYKNFKYGKTNKKTIKSFPQYSFVCYPPHEHDENRREILREYIKL